ncbi:hypothetical protein [Ligilactobacillus sp. LYQ60]|uniref:hypothetical protein n=1 Tax=Ligilactobacillus sp. LYQ60 TaxID=3378799 RepID=UPI003854BF10
MFVSYDSTDLIAEVKEDISVFGERMEVYAIYSLFPDFDKLFITDYVYAEKPERDEYMTDDEYSGLVKSYNEQIASLDKTKHELMTLDELLAALEKQDALM